MRNLFTVLLLFTAISASIAKGGITAYNSSKLPNSFKLDSLITNKTPSNSSWWVTLNDANLDSLITLVIDNNQDIYIALDNIKSARAALRVAQSSLYPTLSLSSGWTKLRYSTVVSPEDITLADNTQDYFSALLSTSWEIDIFGALRKASQEAKYSYQGDIDTYNAVIMSLTAEVATYYAELRTMQNQYIVAQENIESQKSILEITEIRYNTGLASKLDVAQAKSVYYSTKSSLPVLENSIRQQINAITVLAGLYPPQLFNWLSIPSKIPNYIQILDIGTPEEVVQNRPDIMAAKKAIKSAEAAIGGSRSKFLPKFYADGYFGFSATKLDNMIDKNGITYEIAPKLTWDILQGGARFNYIKSSKATYDANIRSYNKVLLSAIQEVDNAVSSYTNRVKQVVSLRELVIQGQITLELSLELYKSGLIDFQTVLDAQRSLLEYQNSLVVAQGYALSSIISIYRATGGGWQDYEYNK